MESEKHHKGKRCYIIMDINRMRNLHLHVSDCYVGGLVR